MSRGLKDNEIAELVNELRDALKYVCPVQCLRDMINNVVIKYLNKRGLRYSKSTKNVLTVEK